MFDMCSICLNQGKETLARTFCNECGTLFCVDCATAHKSQKKTELHSMIDINEKPIKSSDNSGQEKQKCEPCSNQNKSANALKYCKNCKELLCQACSSRHLSQKSTKLHDQIPADQIKTLVISCEPCSENSIDIQAVKACKICKEALCEKCAAAHKSQKATMTHELLDASHYSPYSETYKTCEPCKATDTHIEASEVCVECREFLCKSCATTHKTQKATKTHQVVSVNDILETFCEPCLAKEETILAEKMCHECDEPLCSTCITHHMVQKATRSHQLHDLTVSIAEVHFCDTCCISGNTETAVKWCKTCEEFYCVKCTKTHASQKATKDHNLVNAEYAKRTSKEATAVKFQESKLCNPCFESGKTVTAVKHCGTCEEFLCTKCSEMHLFQNATKTHDLVDPQLAKLTSDESPDVIIQANKRCYPCSKSGKTVNAAKYCGTCEEFLCTKCSELHFINKATKSHNLVDALFAKQTSKESSDVKVQESNRCDPCSKSGKTVTAVKYCGTCEEFYCTECSERHILQKATKEHDLDDEKSTKKASEDSSDMYVQERKLCNPCFESGKTVTAVKHCGTCEEFLCTKCSEMHLFQNATKTHDLVDPQLAKLTSDETSDVIIQAKISDQKTQKGTFAEPTVATPLVVRGPGKPNVREVNSDSVTIHWTPPDNLEKASYYQIRYKEENNRWTFYSENPERETVTIENLQADTTYIFQVRAVTNDEEGPYSLESDKVRTKPSLASRLLGFTSKLKDGQPAIHQLHSTENQDARNEHAKTRKFELGRPPINNQKEKTILLVGATGSGKSTLVDGIINYVTGVNWKDPYRFTLVDLEQEEKNKNQAISQTEWITCYTINPEVGSRLNYRLRIIDTPGFGDTRGLDRDHGIVRQLKELFSAEGPKGVVYIDAVCFLIKAPDARLTAVQNYIFMSILSLFGQDIEKNICTLITFADGKEPPVLAALKEAQMPYDSWYVFNNSGLFASNEESKGSLSPMFWDMGNQSFKRFFDCLERLSTKSLQQTQRVLEERERLEITIQKLQPQVDAGLNKVHELKQEIDILQKHEKDIKDNKDFTYEVEETSQEKIPLPKGQHTTNCIHCNITCHKNCAFANNDDKINCSVMKDGQCTICETKCSWKQHANTPYIFSYTTEKVKKTYAEKLKMYKHAGEQKISHEKLINLMMTDLDELTDTIEDRMEQVNDCNNILKNIALRPNPLTMVEHIDLMIESEKQEKKDGFLQRIKVLQSYRDRAEIHKNVSKLTEEFKTTAKSRRSEYLPGDQKVNLPGDRKANPQKSRILKFFGL